MDLARQEFTTDFHGKPLTLEVSKLADQADAAVLGKYGDTAVLVTVVMGEHDRKEIDHFPLVVDYEEKFYAAGKIICLGNYQRFPLGQARRSADRRGDFAGAPD